MQSLPAKFIEFMQKNSYLTDGNIAYIEELYDAYLKNPQAVDSYWRSYFEKLTQINGKTSVDTPLSDVRDFFIALAKQPATKFVSTIAAPVSEQRKQMQLSSLINAYRTYGHLQAKLDPLALAERREDSALSLAAYGFSNADLTQVFDPGNFRGTDDFTLRGIVNALNKTYCGTFAIEYMHIADETIINWLRDRIEPVQSHPTFTEKEKLRIFDRLTAAEGLEKYLGAKYVGQKRFSLEGGVSLIPMLDELVNRSARQNVQELIMGMAHRGRLNVLVNILGKSPVDLFREFEGKHQDKTRSGDVKYHMGFSSDVKTVDGMVIHLALAFNPSHLEIVNPVVEGAVKARQDRRNDKDYSEVVPLLIHGDAAFAAQGVVMETFAFSQARGFNVGGTIHIVINNQIGFTTSNPLDARSSLYCTDIAKMVQAPVLHVNGDDPEACVFAMQLAYDFRMTFKRDIVIDLVCYRRFGHNEADEPAITQPLMYAKIRSYPRSNEIYAEKLIHEGVINKQYPEKEFERYRDALDAGKTLVNVVPKGQIKFLANWVPYKGQHWDQIAKTSISLERIKALSKQLLTLPDGFVVQPQVERELTYRAKMTMGKIAINWGYAESMAYASLVTEGYPIRFCGQDSSRGTFSHRHASLHDNKNGNVYIPLQHLSVDQAHFTIIDSILSEEGVLGFEYGYATTDPETLVIWEAQYGDFFNGAQVVIDQFMSSGEQKWKRLCGLTLFLPHGYEGAGPEHTSARLERFLQLCAEDNMQVCVPTTPAQFFHMLRRQLIRPYRKPLIVMTPKSLLRNKIATSSLTELSNGMFHNVIGEIDAIQPDKARKVIVCSGKVYYDLLEQRRSKKIDNIAIIRIEQLYPFPDKDLKAQFRLYAKAKSIVWCQEEPKNQGAWFTIEHSILQCMDKGQSLEYVGRASSASPATGYTAVHIEQQQTLVAEALK